MVSVCIATYNGEKFILQQIQSILPQLSKDDEIIISDDMSYDNTIKILENLNDKRIKIVYNSNLIDRKNKREHFLVAKNFENALKMAKGQYIFLSDQDDIWMPDKVKVTLSYLRYYDLVLTDCKLINHDGEIVYESFFNLKKTKPGFFSNLIRSNYHGCCMAFKRKILLVSLPFPKKIVSHDAWIGLLADAFSSVLFLNKKLVLYRIHGLNVSGYKPKSSNPTFYMLSYRLYLFIKVISRFLKYYSGK